MAKNKNFAETMVNDYVNLGFGEKVNDTTIRSTDGENVELEFDAISDEDNGNTIGLELFVNSLSTAELFYDDPEFSEKLLREVAAALNV